MSCTVQNNITSTGNIGKQSLDNILKNIIPLENIEAQQTSFSSRYDNVELTKTTFLMNNFLNSLDPAELVPYEALANRIDNSIITPLEISEFAYTYNYQLPEIINVIPTQFNNDSLSYEEKSFTKLNSVNRPTIQNFNNFYQTSISASVMGGVCSSFLDTFANILNQFNTIQSLVNGITSQILGMFNLAKQLIDKIFSLAKGLMGNIANTIKGIQNSKAFAFVTQKFLAIQSLLSDLSKQSLKDQIETIISTMAGQFKDLTGNIITFILFKVCQIASSIENFIFNPINALNNNVSNYNSKSLPLQTLSDLNQSESIRYGAVRLTQDAIILGRRNVSSQLNYQNRTSGTVEASRYISIPVDDFERSLVVNLSENGNQFIEFSSNVKNMEKIHPSSNPANNIEGAGWRKVHPEVYIKIFRVAERLGKRLLVNSGYRNENYNAAVGGKSASLHKTGMALDISMNGVDPAKFIKYASQEGLMGIGTYPSFVHVDIGSRRTWGTLYSDSLSLHKQDRFRKG